MEEMTVAIKYKPEKNLNTGGTPLRKKCHKLALSQIGF